MRRPPIEILHRDSAYRSVAGILPRGLLHRSCQESSYRELLRPRDLFFIGRLYGDLAKRPLLKICIQRDLAKRSLPEILPRAFL